MTPVAAAWRGRCAAGLILFVFSACTTIHRSAPSPPDAGRLPPFRVPAPVAIVNSQTSSTDVVLPLRGVDVTVNYRDYTASAIALLRRELDSRATAGSTATRKEIRLAIVDLRIMAIPQMRCIVNFTVETGDGYTRGHETMATNWNFGAAIDAAISNVVVAVLNDEQVIAYLEK